MIGNVRLKQHTKAAGNGVGRKAFACLCALVLSLSGVPVAGADSAAADSEGSSQPAHDISADWNAGTASIDEGGEYVLDADVDAQAPLVVSVPAGETVTIDFNGHVAQVAAAYGIDADGSAGTIVLKDSAARYSDDNADGQDSASELEPCLIVDGSEAEGDVRGVSLEADNGEGDASQEEGLSLELEGVGVEVRATADTSSDLARDATAVYAGVKDYDETAEADQAEPQVRIADSSLSASVEAVGEASDVLASGYEGEVSEVDGLALVGAYATLAGSFNVEVQGPASGAGIASAKEGAVTLEDGFTSEAPVSVNVAGNPDGAVVAVGAEGFDSQDAEGVAFEDATSQGATIAYDSEANAFTVSLLASTEGQAAAASQGSSAAANLVQRFSTLAVSTAVSGKDLNALWSASGTSQTLTISEGGTYVLTDDLEVSAPLIVNASGQTVTINLAGHTLSSSATGGYALRVAVASTMRIIDSTGTGSLTFTSSPLTYAVYSAADALEVNGVSINIVQGAKSVSQTDLRASAVQVARGTSSFTDCSLSIDMSQLVASTANSTGVEGMASGVYLAQGAGASTFNNVTIKAQGSMPGKTLDGLDDLEGVGNAYGIYSATAENVSIDGSSFDVSSTLGSAIGVLGSNVSLASAEGEGTSFALAAAQFAIGLYASSESAIDVNAPIAVSYDDTGSSYQTAFYSPVDNGFVFGSSLSGEGLGAWVGPDDKASANADGARIATFEEGTSSQEREAIAACVVNALGQGASCTVASDDEGLAFALDAQAAPFEVESSSGTTPYATLAQALAAMESGDTLRVLQDYGDLSFAPASDGADASFSVDLAGHSLTSFSTAASASVTLFSSADGASIAGVASNGAAVSYSGSGSLTVSGIAVRAVSSSTKAYGAYSTGTGALELDNVTLVAASSSAEVRGVYVRNAKGGNATLNGGSVTVQSLATSSIAYGVSSTSTSNTVSISSCPVSVMGVGGTTIGIEGRSNLSVSGASGETSVSVSTTGPSTRQIGVSAMASGMRVSLADFSVSLSAAARQDGVSYWGVSSNGNNVQISLDGACSFEGPTDTSILIGSSALELGSLFSVAQGSVYLDSDAVSGDTFATGSLVGDAAVQAAAHFAGAQGSEHEGWQAEAQSTLVESTFQWTRDAVVRNSATGASYLSLQDALSSAGAGDVLVLTQDAVESAALSIENDATLDLSGHTLTLDASSAAAAGTANEGAALAIGGGTFTVADSAGTGALDILVGSPTETKSTVYQGISVYGGGKLVLNGSSVSVAYAGATTAATVPQCTVRGVASTDSDVELSGGASLTVRAARQDGSFGAMNVAGVSMLGEGGTVSVDGTSSVTAVNNAAEIDASGSDYADLIPLNVDEGSDLYNTIQEQFYRTADFDANNDDDGYEFGTNIYYSSEMALPDGSEVWAYSDPVESAAAGKKESIVASHVFVDSSYTVARCAYGIEGASSYTGTVDQQGQVSASTSGGNAYAVYLPEGAGESLNEDALSASCDSSTYVVRTGSFDLRNYITFDRDFSETIIYATQNNPKIGALAEVESSAKKVAQVGAEETVEVADGTAGMDALYPQGPDTVKVSFQNVFDATGSPVDAQSVQVPYGSTLQEAGLEPAQPADYTVAGVTYRFIGWRVSGSSETRDAGELESDFAFDADSVAAALTGSVVLYAQYVPVMQGQHLITFKNDYSVRAYAVTDGQRPSYAACISSTSAVPTKLVADTGYTYVFKGWAPGTESDGTWSKDAAYYAGSLPVVTEDVSYTALYQTEVTLTTLIFSYEGDSGSAVGYAYDFDWVNDDALEAADAYQEVGSTHTLEGQTKTLLGWSPRMSDVEPVYTDSIAVEPPSSTMGGRETFYGVYASQTQTADVYFYVGDDLYATASGVNASSTVNAAFSASDNPVAPTQEGKTFRGWGTSQDASSYLYGNVKTIAALLGSDSSSVNLYALFRDVSSTMVTVTFYDEDRSTVLLSISIPEGTTVYESYDEDYKGPDKTGELFQGWVDGDGNDFSVTGTTVTADTSVYAVYTQTGSSTGSLTGSSSSGSGAGSGTSSTGTSSLAGTSRAGASLTPTALAGSSLSGTSLTGASLSAAGSDAGSALEGDYGASDGDSEDSDAEGALGSEDGSEDESSEDGTAEDDAAESVDGNSVGFVVFLVAVAAALALLLRWLWGRRKKDDEEEVEDVAAPETEAIRF